MRKKKEFGIGNKGGRRSLKDHMMGGNNDSDSKARARSSKGSADSGKSESSDDFAYPSSAQYNKQQQAATGQVNPYGGMHEDDDSYYDEDDQRGTGAADAGAAGYHQQPNNLHVLSEEELESDDGWSDDSGRDSDHYEKVLQSRQRRQNGMNIMDPIVDDNSSSRSDSCSSSDLNQNPKGDFITEAFREEGLEESDDDHNIAGLLSSGIKRGTSSSSGGSAGMAAAARALSGGGPRLQQSAAMNIMSNFMTDEDETEEEEDDYPSALSMGGGTYIPKSTGPQSDLSGSSLGSLAAAASGIPPAQQQRPPSPPAAPESPPGGQKHQVSPTDTGQNERYITVNHDDEDHGDGEQQHHDHQQEYDDQQYHYSEGNDYYSDGNGSYSGSSAYATFPDVKANAVPDEQHTHNGAEEHNGDSSSRRKDGYNDEGDAMAAQEQRPVPSHSTGIYASTYQDPSETAVDRMSKGDEFTAASWAESQRKDRRTIKWLLVGLAVAMVILAAIIGGVIGAVAFNKSKDSNDTPVQPPQQAGIANTQPPLTPPLATTPAPGTPAVSTPAPVPIPATNPPPPPPPADPNEPCVPSFGEDCSGDSDEPSTPVQAPVPDSQELLNIISAVSSDGGAAMRTEGTPQNLAYTWIVNDVTQRVRLRTRHHRNLRRNSIDEEEKKEDIRYLQSLSDTFYVQRYVLAVFYYSTDGDNWSNHAGWLTDADECTWFNQVDTGTACDTSNLMVGLKFNKNLIKGVLPPELGLLKSLQTFEIVSDEDDDGLTGGIPKELGTAMDMEHFKITNNVFTERIPEALFENWSKLTVLALTNNKIPGPIPESISALVSLKSLNMLDNQLVGGIPAGIASLASATIIQLGGNELSGVIPPQIGELTALRSLLLANNKLEGQMPEALGDLAAMKAELDLSNNQLSGSIVPELGNLDGMKVLRLNGNNLSGNIPITFAFLNSLKEFHFQDNDLVGEVPSAVCDLVDSKKTNVYGDCEEVACPCCRFCCLDGINECLCQVLETNPGLCG